MSASSLPITPTRFALALRDLPLSSLYAKHAELNNQIQHLETSNAQLEEFARENDDRECYEALLENRLVVKRFVERVELIAREVREVRGLVWRPGGEDEDERTAVNGTAMNGMGAPAQEQEQERTNGMNGTAMNGTAAPAPAQAPAREQQQQSNGTTAQHGADDDDNDGGVYL